MFLSFVKVKFLTMHLMLRITVCMFVLMLPFSLSLFIILHFVIIQQCLHALFINVYNKKKSFYSDWYSFKSGDTLGFRSLRFSDNVSLQIILTG